MSKITEIVEKMHEVIHTILPTYARMPNPYVVAENSALLMRSGYGVGISGGINTNRVIPNVVSIDRTFEIVLVNQIDATPNDTVIIENEEKQILEAAFAVTSWFEKNPTLEIDCINSRYLSDSGIEFIDLGLQRYHQLTLEIGVEYLEPI